MKDLLGMKNINCHSELDSESINLMDNKELALIDSGSESGMTRGRDKCVVTPSEFLSSQCSLRNSTLPVQGGRKLAKAGFTLAEVLITLGIIGVVAAMTIPNLIANTKAHTYRSQFKKTISTLSQAARLSQSQYGFDYAGINQQCGTNAATEHPDEVMSICAILNGTLTGATFIANSNDLVIRKGSSTQKYNISVSSDFFSSGSSLKSLDKTPIYILADGSLLVLSARFGEFPCSLSIGNMIRENISNAELSNCAGFIDVNGTSLPNKEVSCSSGVNKLENNNCIVKNDAQHMTDIYPIRFHDGIVEPATAAARYVLKTAK